MNPLLWFEYLFASALGTIAICLALIFSWFIYMIVRGALSNNNETTKPGR